MSNLDGKIAVVTGAARGIGAATATVLAERGATIVVADILEDLGRESAEEIARHGDGGAEFRKLDVRDADQVRAVADDVVAEHGRVDLLMNNAGVVESSPTFDLDEATWAQTMAVNLSGPFLCSREFGRRMADGGGGAIVNVSSIAGLKAVHPELHVAYDVSKAGIAQMTRSLAAEWASLGIRVNAVAPGYTHTSILDEVGRTDPAILEDWLGQIPMNRLIEPTEIGKVVAFLLSDEASAVTGHVLAADAGYTIW
jgi:NAD(P)-dependent dehydrogenase (short-subunit alcohol dehydrogenase family)